MKASEFLTALELHNWDAPVLISSANNFFSVESVVKEEGKAVLLMARPVPSTEGSAGTVISRDSVLAKALPQGAFANFRGKLIPSRTPEKFKQS